MAVLENYLSVLISCLSLVLCMILGVCVATREGQLHQYICIACDAAAYMLFVVIASASLKRVRWLAFTVLTVGMAYSGFETVGAVLEQAWVDRNNSALTLFSVGGVIAVFGIVHRLAKEGLYEKRIAKGTARYDNSAHPREANPTSEVLCVGETRSVSAITEK